MKSVKTFVIILAIILGGVAGYLYYSYVGCATGSCPLSSSPWWSTIGGAIIGYIFGVIISRLSIKQK